MDPQQPPRGGAAAWRLHVLAPLRHRPFRLLCAGQVISDLGDWLDLLALLTLVVYRWHLGPAALAAVTMMYLLPWAFIGPLTGVWVDRWPRRAVMITGDLVRALVVLALVWAPNLSSVLVLVAVKVIASTCFSPAQQAAIQAVVPAEDLLAANALSRLSVNVTKVLGPGLGGLLVAAVGPRAAFVVDAATFLVSAMFLSRLPVVPSRIIATTAGARHFWRELWAGMAAILQRRMVVLVVAALIGEMVIVESNDSLSVLAFKGLGMDPALVGLAIGAVGLGNVLGALILGQWGRRLHPLLVMGTGKLAVGCVEATIGVALVLRVHVASGLWLPLVLLNGAGFASIWVPYGYVVQRETPPELLGRVSATATGLYTAFGLLGPPLGAVLAERLGVGRVFVITGIALAVLGAVVILLRPPLAPQSVEERPLLDAM